MKGKEERITYTHTHTHTSANHKLSLGKLAGTRYVNPITLAYFLPKF
jgi:hypothetical protein